MPHLSHQFFVLLILFLPLTGFLTLGLAGKKAQNISGYVAILLTLIGLFISLHSAFIFGDEKGHFSISWVSLKSFQLSLVLGLDQLTGLVLPLVHLIALLVQVYSLAYMKGNPLITRYFAFLQLFIFSMNGIVLSGSLLTMYLFWELVGLSSYLLIGFEKDRPRAGWAASKAFILNRIGDALFLTGILVLTFQTGTTEFELLKNSSRMISPDIQTMLGLCLFGGCVAKSAQFPLSSWLPDAMEGPTPVSALIHAATMVAAGIFLMARIVFLLTPAALTVITLIGLITMIDGALRASQEWNIKKILAYSTQSQLGLMVFAVGFGGWQLALFHLVTHAFFKAGLFLSAGSIIHAMTPSKPGTTFDPQDIRNMGDLWTDLPATFLCFAICGAALTGLPFFSGFLSKDAIIAHMLGSTLLSDSVMYLFVTVSLIIAGITAYYMARLMWFVFIRNAQFISNKSIHPHESPEAMLVPMGILAVFSLSFCFSWNPFDASSGWLLSWLVPEGMRHSVVAPILSVLFTLIGIALAYRHLALRRPILLAPGKLSPAKSWAILDGFEPVLSREKFFIRPFQFLAEKCSEVDGSVVDKIVKASAYATVTLAHIGAWLDKNLVDGLVKVVTVLASSLGKVVTRLQSGQVQAYFITTFVGILLILVWAVLA